MSPATGVDKITGEKIAERLTKAEAERCEVLETVVAKGIESFVDVGNALAEIRDQKLWRDRATSFANYCAAYWPQLSRTEVYRLIDAAEVAAILEGDAETSRIRDGLNPTQAEALAPLKADPDALRSAAAKADAATDGEPTAKDFKAAVSADPLMEQRRQRAEERARAKAEKDARAKAEKAEAEAVMTARIEHNREHDPETRRRHINTTVRGFLMDDARKLVDEFDPTEAATALYENEVAVTLADAVSLRDWLDVYCQTIESPGATVTNLRGVQ